MSSSASCERAAATVLVVEDDPTNSMVITDYLAAHGFAVIAASDGEEGLARFAEARPDVAIVDMLLPHRSGLHFARALRAAPGGERVPILLMSAVSKDAYPEQPLPGEVQGYLVKPFRMSDLVERVRELVP